MLEQGANPNAAAFNGVAPLYAVLNIQWAPKSLYPSPKAYQQQKTTYLELMQALLDKGADPNVRVHARCGTRRTTPTTPAWTRAARRRSGARPTPATWRRWAARGARRRSQYPDDEAGRPAVHR